MPMAVASIYGMNFDNMPELETPDSHPLVLAVIAAICGWRYIRFRLAK